MSLPSPMMWVWERFRKSFGASDVRRSGEDDLGTLSDDEAQCTRYERCAVSTATPEAREPVTCSACRVTIHNTSPAGVLPGASCPFCGESYVPVRSLVSSELIPLAVGVGGACRGRSYRSSSEPLVAGFRLPPIEMEEGQFRLGNTAVSHLPSVNMADFLLTGVNTSSLPPIKKDFIGNKVIVMPPSSHLVALENGDCSDPRLETVGSDMGNRKSQPRYPIRHKTRQEFLQDVRRAHQTENYIAIQRFYMRCFDTFTEICALFKVNQEENGARLEEPGLKMEFVYAVHDALKSMPSIIHKTVLKSIINALLEEDELLYLDDAVRSLFVLLQSPVFAAQSSYTIFAHLLRLIVSLSSSEHQLLVHWFRILEVERLRGIVRNVIQFITIRQFPSGDKTQPPLGKSWWWIPTSIKALALINTANNASTPPLLDYPEFYNSALDHIDLMQDYMNWQSPQQAGQFAYCQYPFILSIVAKRIILTKDSEQQMILTARRSLVAKVARHQLPQIDIFFLNIHVRRAHLVCDSLNEIAGKQKDLKKKLKVSFVGEPGLDMGGLTKEWFLLLIKQIFHSDYGMFVYHPHSRCYWFSTDQEGNMREYNLIGL